METVWIIFFDGDKKNYFRIDSENVFKTYLSLSQPQHKFFLQTKKINYFYVHNVVLDTKKLAFFVLLVKFYYKTFKTPISFL